MSDLETSSTDCLQSVWRSHKRSRSDGLLLRTSVVAQIDNTPIVKRVMRIRFVHPYLVVVMSLLAVVGCGKPDPAHRPQRASEITDFSFLFAKNCAGCHGDDGKLGPAPPLNDPIFLALVSDDVLRKTISVGRKGTPMPAFAIAEGAHLKPEQIAALIAGIRKQWSAKSPADDAKAYPPYVASGAKGNPANGAKAFAQRCAGCHGDNGMGTPMTGAVNEGSFLQLMSDQALRRIIITGRPDLGMPDCLRKDSKPPESPMTDQEIKDIVALLATWREASLEEAAPPSPSGSK